MVKCLRTSMVVVRRVAAAMTLITAVIAAVACLCIWSPSAQAAESGVITAPDDASQAWVDVEYVADDVTVQGTWNNESLEFRTSPSGMNAIADVTAGMQYTLALGASEQIETAHVVVTFADADDVIVQESVTTMAIDKQQTPVVPEDSSNPNNSVNNGSITGGSSNADDENAGVSAIGNTGSQIVCVAAAAVLLCAVGLTVLALRNRRYPAHATDQHDGDGLNHKEEAR